MGGATVGGALMGCDIHIQFEIRLSPNGGEWIWPLAAVPPQVDVDVLVPFNRERNYSLFTMLAGVRDRGEGITPISLPRGLPDDMSSTLRQAIRDQRVHLGDHSFTWLSDSDLLEYGQHYFKSADGRQAVAAEVEATLLDKPHLPPEKYQELAGWNWRWTFESGLTSRIQASGDEAAMQIYDSRLIIGFDS